MSTTSLRPPDGGWGWVVVFASFICASVVDGVCNSFGLFLPHFMTYFGESRAMTSLAGSLMAGGFLSVGPLASAIIHVFGCRASVMSGAVLTTAALVFSRFSPNINVFIFVYGVAGGFGLGFIYLPAMVMVGYYFDRRRALALGITCSGGGAGLLAIAPVSAYLLSEFDWKNSCLLMAAFPLQCLVMGTLMRPIDIGRDQSTESLVADNGSNHDIDTKPGDVKPTTNGVPLRPPWLQCTSCHDVRKQANVGQSFTATAGRNGFTSHTPITHHMDGVTNASHAPGEHAFASCHEFHAASSHSKSAINLAKPTHRCHQGTRHGASGDHRSKSYGELAAVTTRRLRAEGFRGSVDSTNPLHRQDVLFGGSLAALTLVDFYPVRRAPSAPRELSEREPRCACPSLADLLDPSVLGNANFAIIAVASVFIQLGYYVPFVYLADYAASLGTDPSSAASLLIIIGVTNTVGRVSAGALANVSGVNILHLNNISLVITGVATALCGALCRNFTHLAIYAAVFGFFVAAFVPLSTMFLIKYLGITKLTKAVGLLSLVRGLSSAAGPPIAGAIRDASTSYSLTFYFAGALFVAAGLVHYLLPLVERWLPSASPPLEADEFSVDVSEDEGDHPDGGRAGITPTSSGSLANSP